MGLTPTPPEGARAPFGRPFGAALAVGLAVLLIGGSDVPRSADLAAHPSASEPAAHGGSTASSSPSPTPSTPSPEPTPSATETPVPDEPSASPSPTEAASSPRPSARAAAAAPAPRPPAPPSTVPSGGWPGPASTGVPAGVSLTASGSMTVRDAGAVLDSLDITGSVTIEAATVVIKNSKIHGSGTGDGVRVENGTVTIYDSEIYGFENSIGYGDWAAYRVNIHSNTGDGVKLGSNTTLQDSWIHDLAPGDDAHADGGQVQDGVTNLVVRHNTIDVSSAVNSALFIQPIFGPSTAGPILIEGNYLSGGGFTVFLLDGAGTYVISNITVRNNRFGRTAEYGPDLVTVPVSWTNNTYADNGASIAPEH